MRKLFILLICVVGFMSCQKDAQQSFVSKSNPNFKPELLFEIDGYKVYRFRDDRTVYFVIPEGSTHSRVDTTGKGSYKDYDTYTVREREGE